MDLRIGTLILRPEAGGERKTEIKPTKILVPGTNDPSKFVKNMQCMALVDPGDNADI